MEIQWAVAAMVVVGAILIRFWRKEKAVEWPVGPSKLPIIGNLHQISKGGELVHVTLAKFAEEYGPMITVWMGGWRPTIVVSNQELAWEVLVTKATDYASRKLPYMSRFVTADWQTLATSDFGPYWQGLRKGVQNAALNPVNISSQTHLQERDVQAMTEALSMEASKNGGVVRPLVQFRRLTMRLVGRICFAFEFNDEKFMDGMDAAVEETIRLTGHARLVDVFAATRFLPGLSLPFKQTYQVQGRIRDLIRPYFSRCKPNSYMNFLLSQKMSEETVIFNIFEMFLLAVDSTSTSISWALAFMICNQDIQEKLYAEIRRITADRSEEERKWVSVEDVTKMQYVHAIVKETMRMKPIAPLAVPHMAINECNLMGTKIPAGTSVIVNIYKVLYDPKVWEEPYRFTPERFMAKQSDGDASARMRAMDRSFLPFGAGRRVCAGMDLAKLHVALTIANLVNAYQWCPMEGQLPDMTEDLTFVLRMKTPLAVGIKPRAA